MRRSLPLFLVAVLVVASLSALTFWILRDRADPGTADPAAARDPQSRTDAPAEAASAAPDAARVEEPSPAPVPASIGTGRFGATGWVRWADGRPAGGARVRAFGKLPPLAKAAVSDAMRQLGSGRKPAASHDLSDAFDRDDSGTGPEPEAEQGGAPEPMQPASRPEAALAEVVAAADGAFELRGLERARFSLDAIAPFGVVAAPVELDLSDDPIARDVTLSLIEGGALRGRVVTPRGEPVADAQVVAGVPFDPFAIFDAGGMVLRGPASTRSAADGSFEFPGLPAPLSLSLIASADGFAPSPATTAAIEPGRARTIELLVRDGATLLVRIEDDGGAPLPGIRCRVAPAAIQLATLSVEGDSGAREAPPSDEAGLSRIHGLAPGPWRVSASVTDRRVAPVTVEIAAPDAEVEARLVVAAGLELRGRVEARDGVPIAGASVVVYPEPSFANLGEMVHASRSHARTAEDGTFSLRGLPAGRQKLDVSARGFQDASLTVEPGGEPQVVVLPSRGILEGIVFSRRDGGPQRRFELMLSRKRDLMAFADASAAESLIDVRLPFQTENGKFRVTGVNPGELQLTVRAEGHGAASGSVELAEGEVRRGILFFLEPEAVIEGVVVDAATLAPLAGAQVRRDEQGGMVETMLAQFLGGERGATTDAEGRFRIGGLSAGAHRVIASREDYCDATSPSVELSAGAVHASLRLELQRGGEIFGTVSAPDGTPAPGVTVLCQQVTPIKIHTAKCDAGGEYRVRGLAPGNYTLTRLPEKLDFGAGTDLAELTNSMQVQSIRLRAGESLRVDFTGAPSGSSTLQGKVTQLGEPVAGALVSAVVQRADADAPSTSPRTATTAADGTYVLEGLPAGHAVVQVARLDLAVAGAAGSSAMAAATLEEGATTRVDLVLPAGSIEGVVADAVTGAPLAGVAVYAGAGRDSTLNAFELAQRRTAMNRTAADGRFELSGLRAGSYRVVAGAADLFSGASPTHAVTVVDGIVVPEGGRTDAGTIRMPPAARITGTVRGAGGAPLAGASIFLRAGADGDYLEEWTGVSSNDAGEFEYVGVPEGRWDVLARAAGHACGVARGVVARPGSAAQVSLELLGGTEVFAQIGEVDLARLLDLRVEVIGPEGRIPLTLFGLGDLADLMAQPWRPDRLRLGRFGPGRYEVRGRLGEERFEKTFELAGEAELTIPVALR